MRRPGAPAGSSRAGCRIGLSGRAPLAVACHSPSRNLALSRHVALFISWSANACGHRFWRPSLPFLYRDNAIISIKPLIKDAEFSEAKCAAEFRCRSVANRVSARPISAVARVARITFKELISHAFLMVTRQISGAKTDFSAVDRGIATGSSSWGPGG
jgi:hypothetical protein